MDANVKDILWYLAVGVFFFMMMRRGGCCGGHGHKKHDGKDSHVEHKS